jgi:hypothetical protein
MLAIIGIITSLAAGSTISVVLAGLSIADWISIAGVLLTVGQDAVKVFIALHPALKPLEEDIKAKLAPEVIAAKAVALHFFDFKPLPWPKPAIWPNQKVENEQNAPSYDDPSKFGG